MDAQHTTNFFHTCGWRLQSQIRWGRTCGTFNERPKEILRRHTRMEGENTSASRSIGTTNKDKSTSLCRVMSTRHWHSSITLTQQHNKICLTHVHQAHTVPRYSMQRRQSKPQRLVKRTKNHIASVQKILFLRAGSRQHYPNSSQCHCFTAIKLTSDTMAKTKQLLDYLTLQEEAILRWKWTNWENI